jgi:RNA polymerase sigma-70 factor (ECF subfamily)
MGRLPAVRPEHDGPPLAGPDESEEAPERVRSGSSGEWDRSAVVAAARRGDEDAYRLLYRDVQPGLVRYLRVLVGQEADDVASETWLQIARDFSSFSGGFEDFRAWATTIARHRAMDHVRRLRRRPEQDLGVDQVLGLPALDDPAEAALDGVSTEAALALIAELPRDQAEAVLLRVVMGLDARAAGRVLGKRAGAVRTAAYRGLRTLAGRVRREP